MRKIGLLILVFAITKGWAIDTHFSQFYSSPLTLNPALTGISYRNIRLNAIYRNQWAIGATKPFQTISVAGDMSVLENRGTLDFGGVGLVMMRETSGLALNKIQAAGSFSYHKGLGKGANHYLALGIQGGIVQSAIDPTNALTNSNWEGQNGVNPNTSNGESSGSLNTITPDIHAGAMWYGFFGQHSAAFAGISLFHINQPSLVRISNSSDSKLSLRYVFNAGSRINWGGNISVVPNTIIMMQDQANEVNIGASLEYNIETIFGKSDPFNVSEQSYRLLSVGAWYRNQDAVIVGATLEYDNLKVGLSYDITISDLKTATGSNSMELSLTYTIAKYNNKTTHLTTSPCPRL